MVNKKVLILFACIIFMQTFASEKKGAEVDGIFVKKIHGINFVAPTSDCLAAWGWKSENNQTGLYIINSRGKILNGQDAWLKGFQIKDVFPEKNGQGAWIVAQKGKSNSLYYQSQCSVDPNFEPSRVNFTGKLDKNEMAFSNASEYKLFTSEEKTIPALALWSVSDPEKLFNLAVLSKKDGHYVKDLSQAEHALSRKCAPRFSMGKAWIWTGHTVTDGGKQKTYVLKSIDEKGNCKEYPLPVKVKEVRLFNLETAADNSLWIYILEHISSKRKRDAYKLHLLSLDNPNSDFSLIMSQSLSFYHAKDNGKERPYLTFYPINKSKAWIWTDMRRRSYEKGTVGRNQLFAVEKRNRDALFHQLVDTAAKRVLYFSKREALLYILKLNDNKVQRFRFFNTKNKGVNFHGSQAPISIAGSFKIRENYDGTIFAYCGNIGVNHYAEGLSEKLTGPILKPYSFIGDRMYSKYSAGMGWINYKETANKSVFAYVKSGHETSSVSGNKKTKEESHVKVKDQGKVIDLIGTPASCQISYPKKGGSPKVTIYSGSSMFDSKSRTGTLIFGEHLREFSIHVDADAETQSNNKYKKKWDAKLFIKDPLTNSVLAQTYSNPMETPIGKFPKIPFPKPGAYKLRLVLTEKDGSHLVYCWDRVLVKKPFLQRWYIAILLAFFAIICTICFQLYNHSKQKLETPLGSWIPLAIFTSSGVIPAIASFISGKTGWDTAEFVLLFFVASLIFAIISLKIISYFPPSFRTIAKAHPFTLFSPWFVRLHSVRALLYQNYIARHRMQIKLERESADNENYLSLPVEVKFKDGHDLGNPDTVENPVSYVQELLIKAPRKRPRLFLFEGVAGTGKSALAKEITENLFDQFEAKRSRLLPVYLSKLTEVKSISEALEEKLADDGLSANHIEAQSVKGKFIFILDIDNLANNTDIFREITAKYVPGTASYPCPLLIFTRHNSPLQKAFRVGVGSDSVLFETLPINSENMLTKYVSHYKAGYSLPKEVQNAFKDFQGNYNPLLIRKALEVVDNPERIIFEGFSFTIKAFLEKVRISGANSDIILNEIHKICIDNYLEDGNEHFCVPNDCRNGVQALLQSGVIVSKETAIGRNSTLGSQKTMKFVNKMLLVTLTGRAIAAEIKSGNMDYRELIKAAGAPHFINEARDNRQTSLFIMCLNALLDSEKAKRELSEYFIAQINSWASENIFSGTDLNNVVDVESFKMLPGGIKKDFADYLSNGELTPAVDKIKSHFDALALLFERLAPMAYKAKS